MGIYEYNQRNVRGQWDDILNEITDVTGEVFLGLSMGCARCHDHKFDPILQKDYYRLQAFFTPLLPRDDLTLAKSRQWAEYQSRRAAWEKAAADILRQIDEIERPYRDKGGAGAVAKFPDEIQAILRQARAGAHAAGAAARRAGLSPDQLRARAGARVAQGGGQGPLATSCTRRSSDSTPCGRSRPEPVLDGDRRRAGVAADL